jgi:signal transduction histidine kinase
VSQIEQPQGTEASLLDAKSPMRRPGEFAWKLAAAFVLVLIVLGGTAIFSIGQLMRSVEARDVRLRRYLDDVVLAERLRSAEDAEAAAGRGYLLTRNPDFLDRLEEAELAFERAFRDLRSRISTEDGSALLSAVLGATSNYEQARRRVLADTATDGHSADIRRRFEREVVPARYQLNDAIAAFIEHKEKRLDAGYDEARRGTTRAIVLTTVVLSLALAASGLLAWKMGQHLARMYRRESNAVQSAARALAARDELLGIVAHDLRSPLSAIALRADLLKRGAADAEAVRSQAGSIRNITIRMESVIKSLLDATSMDAGSFSVKPSPCDAEELVRESMEVLASVAAAKFVRLEAQFDAHGLAVSADRERALQILTNLMGNAIKFAFEGGSVDVRVARLGSDVRFSVSDTGPGIASGHLQRVFERFWKSEGGSQPGTGLGLHIAKSIVEAHGGRIWAESRLGNGATFHFTLPLVNV